MKKNYLEIFLGGESFFLLPQRAMFRQSEKQLILCDIHFGKASHFRKQGIALPVESHLKDLDKLSFLLKTWRPHTVMILGDLFHSDYNREWWWFKSLLQEFNDTQFILVEGNHDILSETNYELPNLLKSFLIEEKKLVFSHHPIVSAGKLNICGHVHPGVRLHGRAKQSQSFPCFYCNGSHFIMPAFGHLTGMKLLDLEKGSDYYLLTGQKVEKL